MVRSIRIRKGVRALTHSRFKVETVHAFLHVWKDQNTSTSGCTAMQRSDLETIVSWLEPNASPYFALLPIPEYQKLLKGWGLPELK